MPLVPNGNGKVRAETLQVALRFERRTAAQLRRCFDALTERSRQEPAVVKLFQWSIDAAETGEPLIVTVNGIEEALRISHQFGTWGISPPPTLDVLDG